MNLFAHNTGRESIKTAQTSESYVTRRAVRYAAADNAQAALQRQFPGMSFGVPFVGTQAVSQQVSMQQDQSQTTNVGALDESAQTA
jgi:hypothetical protein